MLSFSTLFSLALQFFVFFFHLLSALSSCVYFIPLPGSYLIATCHLQSELFRYPKISSVTGGGSERQSKREVMSRGEIIHDFSGGRKEEEVTFWFLSLKEAKMVQVEL